MSLLFDKIILTSNSAKPINSGRYHRCRASIFRRGCRVSWLNIGIMEEEVHELEIIVRACRGRGSNHLYIELRYTRTANMARYLSPVSSLAVSLN